MTSDIDMNGSGTMDAWKLSARLLAEVKAEGLQTSIASWPHDGSNAWQDSDGTR